MIAFLILMGLGLSVALLLPDSDGDGAGGSEEQAPDTPEIYSEGNDQIIAEGAQEGVAAYWNGLVGEGEVTQAEADALIGGADYVQGAMNVDAAGGDDLALGSEGNDIIDTGAGDDVADGGLGDDEVQLGEGSDVYGVDWRVIDYPDDFQSFPNDYAPFGTEADYEGGDDTVSGGGGNDFIADGYGANVLKGRGGADLLVAVDQDGVTPDEIYAGSGDDRIFVDEGDFVTTAAGADIVTIEIHGTVEEGYQVITISDFNPEEDRLEVLERVGEYDDERITDPVTVEDLEDGTGALLSIGGVPVAVLIGGQGMTVEDIVI
ncbi:MAG: calcium-binding protein [Paracoccaceae bacterium]